MATKKIGELLLENKIITESQLDEALALQRRKGGLLGFTLIELGYLKTEVLNDFLDMQIRLQMPR